MSSTPNKEICPSISPDGHLEHGGHLERGGHLEHGGHSVEGCIQHAAAVTVASDSEDVCPSTDVVARRIKSAGPRLQMLVDNNDTDGCNSVLINPVENPRETGKTIEKTTTTVESRKQRPMVRCNISQTTTPSPSESVDLRSTISPNIRFQCLGSLLQQNLGVEVHGKSSEGSEGQMLSPSPSPPLPPSPATSATSGRFLVLDPAVGIPGKEKLSQMVEESSRKPRIVSVKREECMKTEHAAIFLQKDPAAGKHHRAVTVSRSHTWSFKDGAPMITGNRQRGIQNQNVSRNVSMLEKSAIDQDKSKLIDDEHEMRGSGSEEEEDEIVAKTGAADELSKIRSKSMERKTQRGGIGKRSFTRSNSMFLQRTSSAAGDGSPLNICNVNWTEVRPEMKIKLLSQDGGKDNEKRLLLEKDELTMESDTGNEAETCPDRVDVIQRCVIVHRDEKGYGFTVCGDNPVLVESVKLNGPAYKAGVRQYDKIVKVNGTNVLNSNHAEVVKLIKSGSYVALTLLGRTSIHPPKTLYALEQNASSPATPSTPSTMTSPSSSQLLEKDKISSPQAVDHDKDLQFRAQRATTIQLMHRQVQEEYEKMKFEYQKCPSESLQEKLQSKLQMLRRVEDQLRAINSSQSEVPSPAVSEPSLGLPLKRPAGGTGGETTELTEDTQSHHLPSSLYRGPIPWNPSGKKHRKADSMPDPLYKIDEDSKDSRASSVKPENLEDVRNYKSDSEDVDVEMKTVTVTDLSSAEPFSRHDVLPLLTIDPASASDSVHDTTEVETPSQQPGLKTKLIKPSLKVVSPSQVKVVIMEDTDFSSVDDPGVFCDLMQLKFRPAHTAVFLNYLASNSDPAAMLFYLVTESYIQGNIKEMKKWAYEIFSTFLCDRAPLKINVDESTVTLINTTLQTKSDREDLMKNIFQSARIFAQNEINDHLTDFRSKRALGLGSLYGDRDLRDNMDRQLEMKIVENALWKHFERLVQDEDSDRSQAMASALATFFKQVGYVNQKNNTLLERCSSFNTKEKRVFKIKTNNKKVIHTNGHQFVSQHYCVTTFCFHCQNVLWGIGNQGYQCTNCDINLHKNCVDLYKDNCSTGSMTRKKKERRQPFMFDLISRKLSNTNPAAIKEAQHQHYGIGIDSPLPTSGSTLFVRSNNAPEAEETGVKSSALEESNGHFGSSVTRATSMPSVRDVTSNPSNGQKSFSSAYAFLSKTLAAHHKESDHLHRIVSSNIGSPVESDKSPDEQKTSLVISRDQSPDYYEDEYNPNSLSVGLGRSESLNQRSGIRASVRRAHSDVCADNQILAPLPNNSSGSSSDSSLSARTSDSSEGLNDITGPGMTAPVVVSQKSQFNDSDFDVETELPILESIIPKELFRKLKPKEKRRQEVINELFYTERTHVRNLKVLYRIFYLPMAEDPLFSALFPNLEEIIEIHCALNNEMKARRKENPLIGEFANILIKQFTGEEGEKFKMAAAKFCEHQSHALEMLRQRQRKDQKMAAFLQEASNNSLCRRLELKDIIPGEMQRLTKYPLLMENLLKYTVSNTDEYNELLKVHDHTKDLLNYVNHRIEDCENHQKLVELQKRLDRRPIENSTHPVVEKYKKLDLTRHKMIYDGVLTWRINRSKQIDHHVVLLEDILVLLQKQDERLVLRCQSGNKESGKDDAKLTHSPIIKLNNVLMRNVAVDKRAFFLVSISDTSGPQIYELAAGTKDERNKWFKYITDAAESCKAKERPKNKEESHLHPDSHHDLVLDEVSGKTEGALSKTDIDHQANDGIDIDSDEKRENVDSLENVGRVEVLNFEPPELVQPNEVKVSCLEVMEKLEPVKTPIDLLKEKNRLIEMALFEKKKLLSNLLQIPQPNRDQTAEISSDIKELLFGSLEKADELTQLISEGLNKACQFSLHSSENPPILVKDKTDDDFTPTSLSGLENHTRSSSATGGGPTITVSSSRLMSITSQLHQHLMQLMDLILKKDEERNRTGDQCSSSRTKASKEFSHPESKSLSCYTPTGDVTAEVTTEQSRCIKLSPSLVTFPVVMEHVEVIEAQTIITQPASVVVQEQQNKEKKVAASTDASKPTSSSSSSSLSLSHDQETT